MAAGAQRILIDATMTRRGGGFTYLVNLLPLLASLAPERQFRMLLRNPTLRAELPPAANVETTLYPETGFGRRLAFTMLAGPRIAADWNADLYFGAGDLAPLSCRCPVIASFRNPNVFTSLDQEWYAYQVFRLGALRRLSRLTARRCRRILFVSHDSARWIGDAIALPEERRAVVHHGIDLERFQRDAPSPHPRPYVLSVSSIYRYKNFVRLIEAWTQLATRRDDVPDLVIAGDDMDPDYSVRMRAAREAAGRLSERIRIVGDVPYAEIGAWYRNAALFVFPSYLETFGHPLLEAMAAGVPVLSADIPVLREVAGEAAHYVDPYDTAALERALEHTLFEATVRDALVARGKARAARLSWENSAREHLSLFDEVVKEAQTS
ncbi:MAG: glycosyltransferase family 1 protein [Myxococcota bacterium]|nr:glycosyltransferase family 1 protein [Myxococcota bacterium]